MKKTTSPWERCLQAPTVVVADERKEKEEITSSLPDEIITDILSMLPMKSILRFRCVCKYWHNKLFKDPSFINTHLYKSIESKNVSCVSISNGREFSIIHKKSSQLTTFEDDCLEPMNVIDIPLISQLVKYPNLSINTLGSCNGLILMRIYKGIDEINLCLWNPTTKEFKEIELDLKEKRGQRFPRVLYGLGYKITKEFKEIELDYKIVRVGNGCAGVGSEVQIYTLGLDSWKTLPDIVRYEMVSNTPAFVNGALHWIATPCPYFNDPEYILIVSFDIRHENFREVPLTPQVYELIRSDYFSYSRRLTLGVLEECLCAVLPGPFDTQVWLMKDHEVRESWTKLFTAKLPVEKPMLWGMTLQCELKNGKVLFRARSSDSDQKGTYFVIYDSGNHMSEVSEIYRISEHMCTIETYVESLVSIAGTYARWEQEFPPLNITKPRRKQVSKSSEKV